MSIFGKLDSASIPTNPYFIPADEYTAEVTGAFFKNKNDGTPQLHIVYTIVGGKYDGKTQTQFFDLPDPELTQETLEEMSDEDQKKILNNLSALKRALSGNKSNSRHKGLGVDPDALDADDWNPETLKGTKVNIAIYNYGEEKEGTGVRWANIID